LSSDLASLRIRREQPPPGASAGRRVLTVLIGLAVLGGGVAFAYQKLGPRIYKQSVAITEVAMVSPAQSSVIVTATGYVVPQAWSKVGAKVTGRLSKVLIKEGDVVKAGDVIAILDGADQRSAVAAAESRVAVARAGAETARANLAEVGVRLERAKALVGKEAMPRMELQDLEARHKVMSESVRAADAQSFAAGADVNTWKVGLKDRAILAPISGTVITKPAMIGETVGPLFAGTSNVAEIADFSSIVVEADVPEARLGLVPVGCPAEIVLDAYPSRRYRGMTVDIGKRVNRAKATVIVKVKFKDTLEGVLPDMSARVSFLREELKTESLQEKAKKVVAAGAIVDRSGGGGKGVWVVEDGKLHFANVATGAPVGGSIELIEGPAAGARVVKNPSAENFEGQRIKEGE